MDPAADNAREATFERLRTEPFPDRVGSSEHASEEAAAVVLGPEHEPEIVATYSRRRGIVTVQLDDPITINGQKLTMIILNPPTFLAVERVVTGAIAQIDMYAEAAGLPASFLRRLRWSDFDRVAGCVRAISPELNVRR
jgi:hypothetical protein